MFAKNGRYGPYVQWGAADELPPGLDKPKMASLFKTMTLERITVDDAEELLSLPRTLGADPADGEEILANNGRYGPYVAKGKDFRTIDQRGATAHDHAATRHSQIFAPQVFKRGGPQHGGLRSAARVRHRSR